MNREPRPTVSMRCLSRKTLARTAEKNQRRRKRRIGTHPSLLFSFVDSSLPFQSESKRPTQRENVCAVRTSRKTLGKWQRKTKTRKGKKNWDTTKSAFHSGCSSLPFAESMYAVRSSRKTLDRTAVKKAQAERRRIGHIQVCLSLPLLSYCHFSPSPNAIQPHK